MPKAYFSAPDDRNLSRSRRSGFGDSVVIIGARGQLGEVLLERLSALPRIPDSVHLLDFGDAIGETIAFGRRELELADAAQFEFNEHCRVLVFGESNPTLIGRALDAGAQVIDCTGGSLRASVPVLVPESGNGLPFDLSGTPLIAGPSGIAVALTRVLRPISHTVGIARLTVSTYQSVSVSGAAAIEELGRQTVDLLNFRDPEVRVLPRRIAFNVIPQVGTCGADEDSDGERRLSEEVSRLLGSERLLAHVTAVQVPMFYGFAATVQLETLDPLGAEACRELLAECPDVALALVPDAFPTPADEQARSQVQVGRVRRDPSHEQALALWVVGDELALAAENAIHLLAQLIEVGATDG